MYAELLVIHSIVRWVVLAGLLLSIYRAYNGHIGNKPFSKIDNAIRHWTATIGHIQLTIGIILYMQSPVVKYFRTHFKESLENTELLFFGLIHITLMIIAVIVLTVGSSLAKRQTSDAAKFKTMLLWFSITLVIIFIAIPWPFSPLATRPLIRTF